MPFRPWVIFIVSLAMLSSCGEKAAETRSGATARRAPAPFLEQDPFPGPTHAETGEDRAIDPERERVACDLLPPPERAQKEECGPPIVPPWRPPPRIEEPSVSGDTPYPEPEPLPEGDTDIYADLDEQEPFPVEHDPPPALTRYKVPQRAALPDTDQPAPEEPVEFSRAALGVGAAGLGVSALSLTLVAENPTTETMIFSGAMLGVGVAALAAGGIAAAIDSSEGGGETTVAVSPGGVVVSGSF